MINANQVERQVRHSLSEWFLGLTVSALPRDYQDTVLEDCRALARDLEGTFNVAVDVPALAERPGMRVDDDAMQLNALLRKAMYTGDLFIVVIYGQYSNGVAYELSVASEYAVPVIFCTHTSVVLPETFERGELKVLERFSFTDMAQLRESLVAWLERNRLMLGEIASRREATRSYIETLRIGSVLERACQQHAQLTLDQIGESQALSPFFFLGGVEGRSWSYAGVTLMQLVMWAREADISLLELLFATNGGIRPKFDLLLFEVCFAEDYRPQDIAGFAAALDSRWKKSVEALPREAGMKEISERLRLFIRRHGNRSNGNGH